MNGAFIYRVSDFFSLKTLVALKRAVYAPSVVRNRVG